MDSMQLRSLLNHSEREMASGLKRLAKLVVIALLLIVALIIFSPKNNSASHGEPHSAESGTHPAPAETPVNFAAPLYTKNAALVCPLVVSLDAREGYGLKGAIDAHLSLFGRQEAVEKVGCAEWREGLPIALSDEGRTQAVDFENQKLCGMVNFARGYIFSCDLRNASEDETKMKQLQDAEKQVSTALQDPDKVRLMECIGVNPWKEKPSGWTSPTVEECSALQEKLGATPDAIGTPSSQ
ncbi:hypothetical protein [Terriglobus sp. RCC_193]|uniref:hypothetical protein n=1 Tax=Terriglobus sp. RCC_193 TaxID=3239218 RepID=UPI0035241B08